MHLFGKITCLFAIDVSHRWIGTEIDKYFNRLSRSGPHYRHEQGSPTIEANFIEVGATAHKQADNFSISALRGTMQWSLVKII